MAVVLITGSNSGFGQATALAFARAGDTVYASVRNLARGVALAQQARDPADVANLLVRISRSDGSQLRWPADDVAVTVLRKMFAQDDRAR